MEVMRGYAMSAKTTRVRVLRRMSVAVLAVLAAVVLMPSRAGASVMTMADLLSGASIQSGDKLFYGFSDYSSNASGGATSVVRCRTTSSNRGCNRAVFNCPMISSRRGAAARTV